MEKTYDKVLFGILFGFYFYFLQQILFFLRFGTFNQQTSSLDISLVLVGAISVWMLMYLRSKFQSPDDRRKLWAAFGLSAIAAVFTSLMGGLLGFIGILIFGLAPFVVVLGLTNILLSRSK